MDKTKLIAMMSDPSAWRGLIYMLTAAGITLAPDQQNSIIAGGLALAGIVHAFGSYKS